MYWIWLPKWVLLLSFILACEYPKKLTEDDAIYYVNTRRLQNEDIFSNYKSYLSQFTFAILPAKQDAVNEDYVVRVFSVVVPADNSTKPEFKPWVDEVCPFDFSMDFDIDPTQKIPVYLTKDSGGGKVTINNGL